MEWLREEDRGRIVRLGLWKRARGRSAVAIDFPCHVEQMDAVSIGVSVVTSALPRSLNRDGAHLTRCLLSLSPHTLGTAGDVSNTSQCSTPLLPQSVLTTSSSCNYIHSSRILRAGSRRS